MEITVLYAVVLIVGKGVFLARADVLPATTRDEARSPPNSEIDDLKKQVDSLEKIVQGMAKQLMTQQLSIEERVRSDGSSGLKLIRLNRDGLPQKYFSETHSGSSLAVVRDHADNIRTVGMGEFIGVLNGVEFRTRHNDYRLHMPSTTTKNYGETVAIPFPDVPPSVSNKETVTEQITEMRKYFEAFQKQDKSIRDSEPYFKPVICYLEGGWMATEPTDSSSSVLDESDFHEIVRFASYTGGRGNKKFPFFPRTAINTTEHGQPVYSHWHYRILCHLIKTPLKLTNFKLVDDLEPRLRLKTNLEAFGKTSEARFSLTAENGDNSSSRNDYSLLDQIMQEIPGVDNYQGDIQDKSFGLVKYKIDSADNTVLNAAYYHRLYKAYDKSGVLTLRRRGFSDPNLFVAMTTHDEIAEVSAEDCSYNVLQETVCHQYKARNTFAIPLEIIWTTPLSKWNPYDVRFHDESHANYVTKDGRNGNFDQSHAFNGSSAKMFYQTPVEFYTTDADGSGDIADTFSGVVGVLDHQGKVRKMAASGIRTFLPEIPNIGVIRVRYPIFPLHAEGSTTTKNLAALQEILLNMKQYSYMFEPEPDTIEPSFPSPGTN